MKGQASEQPDWWKDKWKHCPAYQVMKALEGSLFRCRFDPHTQVAMEQHHAGIWCGIIRSCDATIEELTDYQKTHGPVEQVKEVPPLRWHNLFAEGRQPT